MIPAYAATLLKNDGHDVIWDDAIATNKTLESWEKDITKEHPNLIAIETKTPVIKSHWTTINRIKNLMPDVKVVLYGDHVTRLPLESFEKSAVDYVITGGDYDFVMLSLANYLEGRSNKMEGGIYYRDGEKIKNSGLPSLKHDLNSLPFVDRDLTKWELYAYTVGNFKYTPGTYTMVGRDCWWRLNGGCTFCSWTSLYPNYKVRKPDLAVEEVEYLVNKYKIKEIFDDTGTFPVGNWLKRFAELIIERGLNERVYLGCNMRFGVLKEDDYRLMKKANFRFILFGFESANRKTLGLLNKGITPEEQIQGTKMAAKAGLDPHLTIMFGYPWETKDEVMETMNVAKQLIRKGYAKTWQVTIVTPYVGTKLYDQAVENGWLSSNDYDEFDMKEPVLKTSLNDKDVLEAVSSLYSVAKSPDFVIKRLLSIRSVEDIRYIMRGVRKIVTHTKDFSPSN